MCVCVCVCEREKVCVCVRERECVCVCVREKIHWTHITYALRTHVKDFYTPCFLCTEVVRDGSRRFEGVEPLGNSVHVPYTSCYHCVDEGSVQSNHSELTSKTSTHLAFSALKWFEKVRGGSLWLNHLFPLCR